MSSDQLRAIRSLRTKIESEVVDKKPENRYRYVKERLEQEGADPDVREIILELYTMGYKDAGEEGRDKAASRKERLIAFVCGVVLLVTSLVVALVLPQPSQFQYEVTRIIISLAAAAFALFIEGSLEVRIPGWVRATGAIAVFVIVYFFSPGVLPSPE